MIVMKGDKHDLKTHYAAEDFGFDVIELRRSQDACMLASVF